MNWRQLSRLLREEGRFADERRLHRRVAERVYDEAENLFGPLGSPLVDPEDLMGDVSWKLRPLGTPDALDLADEAEELDEMFGNPQVEADDDEGDPDDDLG